jgi:hypothetical protein
LNEGRSVIPASGKLGSRHDRFEEQDGRIARIRSYVFGDALGVPVLTALYRAPRLALGAERPELT